MFELIAYYKINKKYIKLKYIFVCYFIFIMNLNTNFTKHLTFNLLIYQLFSVSISTNLSNTDKIKILIYLSFAVFFIN